MLVVQPMNLLHAILYLFPVVALTGLEVLSWMLRCTACWSEVLVASATYAAARRKEDLVAVRRPLVFVWKLLAVLNQGPFFLGGGEGGGFLFSSRLHALWGAQFGSLLVLWRRPCRPRRPRAGRAQGPRQGHLGAHAAHLQSPSQDARLQWPTTELIKAARRFGTPSTHLVPIGLSQLPVAVTAVCSSQFSSVAVADPVRDGVHPASSFRVHLPRGSQVVP